MRSTWTRAGAAALALLAATGCGDDPVPVPDLRFGSDRTVVVVRLDPFELVIENARHEEVLRTITGEPGDKYGAPAATVDTPEFASQSLPGWDGYSAVEALWRRALTATVVERTEQSATFELATEGLALTLAVVVEGPRVRLRVDAREQAGAPDSGALNKTTVGFRSGPDEHFFGLGERYASVDHHGLSLYAWPEEGALGAGEGQPAGPTNPYPNGPSMTYFPVPFWLSSRGYAVHLDTTFRSEVHYGSERADAWRFAVNAPAFEATVYVHDEPLASLDDYTADTGRPPIPAPWVFGPRRRVNVNAMALGVPEWQAMRDHHIAVTAVDDAVHFLPALSQLGQEDVLATWTSTLHQAGYKAMAYNNPYVAESDPNAAADYAYGLRQGFFLEDPSGQPTLTQFVSGKLLTLATIDLTNPDAVAWFQDLLRRTLDLGYDGWMHDFGEYVPRDAVAFDGRRGDELHNAFPVLSAKAAHDLLEEERPGDYLFFVRSGGSGTQAFVPAVWGGDAEATFDDTLGLPSSVRGGVNLAMSGVPYWGSDMTGFKCLTGDAHDKEVFLRWVELGAVSPIMMEQDACANPIAKMSKWKLWNDEETITTYARYARLHTRLLPYFLVLAADAHRRGAPLTLHPFLLHPKDPEAARIDDAYYLGPSLYVTPIVRRGQTHKSTWLPPGRLVDLDDLTVVLGGRVVEIDAPLGKLPLFLVADRLLPMLDPSIDTLAPATDPSVITLDSVADRLDVVVALSPGGHATMTLADGTLLDAGRAAESGGNPGGLAEVDSAALPDCAGCFHASDEGDVARLRANGELEADSEVVLDDVTLRATGGPARRVRWDVLRL